MPFAIFVRDVQVKMSLNRLSKSAIISVLPTELIRWEAHYYPALDSTQTRAGELFRREGRGGIFVATNYQGTGRGREGRPWTAPRGQALLFSFILLPGHADLEIHLLTVTTALAVCTALRLHLALAPEVKWPNDVLLNGKKVCGILTEMVKSDTKESGVIVGVGLNVNQRAKDFSGPLTETATSLRLVKGRLIPRIPLLGAIMRSFEEYYFLYQKGERGKIIRGWKRDSAMLGRRVSLRSGRREVQGTVIDLADNGALVLRLDTGRTESFLGSDCRYI
jgi:BirA family biotin operon repressor/biotin-[acetyl-CoA-carboxylase] ligase